jgi:hypothetical protein
MLVGTRNPMAGIQRGPTAAKEFSPRVKITGLHDNIRRPVIAVTGNVAEPENLLSASPRSGRRCVACSSIRAVKRFRR